MQRITIANLVLEPETRILSNIQGDEITLRPLPYNVFTLLLDQKGTCLERDLLFNTCWEGAVVTDQALTNVISALRKYLVKLQAEGIEIKTVSKVGYVLIIDESITLEKEDIVIPAVTNSELKNRQNLSTLNRDDSLLIINSDNNRINRIDTLRKKLFTKPSIISIFVCILLLVALLGGYWLKSKAAAPYFLVKNDYQSFSIENADIYILNKTKQTLNIEKIQKNLEALNPPLCNAEMYVRIYYSAYDDDVYSLRGYMLAKNSNRNGNYTVNEFSADQLSTLLAEALTRAKLICE